MPEQDEHLCSTCVCNRVCSMRLAFDESVTALKNKFLRTGRLVVQGKAEYDVTYCEEYRERGED